MRFLLPALLLLFVSVAQPSAPLQYAVILFTIFTMGMALRAVERGTIELGAGRPIGEFRFRRRRILVSAIPLAVNVRSHDGVGILLRSTLWLSGLALTALVVTLWFFGAPVLQAAPPGLTRVASVEVTCVAAARLGSSGRQPDDCDRQRPRLEMRRPTISKAVRSAAVVAIVAMPIPRPAGVRRTNALSLDNNPLAEGIKLTSSALLMICWVYLTPLLAARVLGAVLRSDSAPLAVGLFVMLALGWIFLDNFLIADRDLLFDRFVSFLPEGSFHYESAP